MNSSVPISADGIIPVSSSDVGSFPTIAFSIPDFEGEAILRLYANSTQSEIGCYSAVITNGHTFSQPKSVGTVLGIFTFIAVVASFATAIYGESIPIMRTHYAHSMSVMVVFAVLQHIFFTGALSMNWPSVLVAWWSNFAWAGGMINTANMQSSINHLIGNNLGNTSAVGAAGTGTTQNSLGGAVDISSIYRRALSLAFKRDIAADIYMRDPSKPTKRDIIGRGLEQAIQRRDLANSSDGYNWYGTHISDGLPLPGNYSGFAGTLAQEGIRVSNAFMTGFLWFLILLVLLVAAVVAFKWLLEGLVSLKRLKPNRLHFFRQNWIAYAILTALRICYIAFFMIMFLTMFEFSYQSSGGVKAIAALVFTVFLVGIPACIFLAIRYRMKQNAGPQNEHTAADDLDAKPTKGLGFLGKSSGNVSIWKLSQLGEQPGHIHEDEEYTMKYGWLAARFRRSRWWFFAAWTFYDFLRACFYGGASGHPKTQVFGLLVIEIIAFAGIIWARPFEGKRLNLLVVYLLGISKVFSVGLSAAFDVSFNLGRVATTAIGIVIIVIQGILMVVTLVAIIVGAISTYMSLTRNREDFRPRKYHNLRERYFVHLDQAATDVPRPPKNRNAEPEEPKGPYFNVSSVRRLNKIEDDDQDFATELQSLDPAASAMSLNNRASMPAADRPYGVATTPNRRSRTMSVASNSRSSLPFGARPHRPSWTSYDFENYDSPSRNSVINMSRNVPEDHAIRSPPSRSGTQVRPVASLDSLKLGGDRSASDTIAHVPTPAVRPRSGTWNSRAPSRSGSRAPSRNGTPTPSIYQSDVPLPTSFDASGAGFGEAGRRGKAPLTPAVEHDEDFAKLPQPERMQ